VCGVDHPLTVQNVGSGLIYAAIIVMWALYFIPRWLRRHEELSESRSVEKFDHAMRILSRRDPTPDQRYIVMPAKPEPAAAPRRRSSARVPQARSPQAAPSARARSQGRSSMTVRRRRVLAAFVLITVLVAVSTPLSPLPWWAAVLAVLATLVDLAHLRMQERRRREVTRTRHAVRKRVRSRLHRADSAERLAEARQLLAERRAAAEAERVEAEWAAHEAARRDAERAAGWQPTPVPLPTYVTKPVAPRASRPIDLTKPGAWTEAQGSPLGAPVSAEEIFDQTSETRLPSQGAAPETPDAGTAAATASASKASYDDYAAELEEILERRRAVND
jgi:hypothetical protein